ncbi:MAG: DUF3169 family protein [Bacillota bacterium]|nr:DUF3169 family protein [Bacillota bacterium]
MTVEKNNSGINNEAAVKTNKETAPEEIKVVPNPEVMAKLEEINTEEVEKEIKTENKKAIKKYVIGLILCGIGGGIIGFLTSFLSEHGEKSPVDAIQGALLSIAPIMLPIIFVVCGLLMLMYYRKAKSLYSSWNGENENVAKDVEESISRAMLTVSAGAIIGLFFMGIAIARMFHNESIEHSFISNTAIMFGYVVLMFFFVFCQKKLVDYTKVIHPEKKGSVFDINFADVWLESCDEAEQLTVYKAAYAAYKFINMFLVILWAISMFIFIGFGIGLLAMTMISAAWLALNVAYSLKAMKLEREQ